MDIDVETFYREQDEHMNLSDDDLDEYLTRLSSNRRRCVQLELKRAVCDIDTPERCV